MTLFVYFLLFLFSFHKVKCDVPGQTVENEVVIDEEVFPNVDISSTLVQVLKVMMDNRDSSLEDFEVAADDATQRVQHLVGASVQDAKARVQSLSTRVSCIQRKASIAREDAILGIREFGDCLMDAGNDAANTFIPVLKRLDHQAAALARSIEKIIRSFFQCRKTKSISTCAGELFKNAENAAAPISNNIRRSLNLARNGWKQLRKEVKDCIMDGAEQAVYIEKDLQMDILHCLE